MHLQLCLFLAEVFWKGQLLDSHLQEAVEDLELALPTYSKIQ